MKKFAFALPLLFCNPVGSFAQSFELLAEFNHAEYTDGMGERNEGSVLASNDFGDATVVVEGKVGERKYPTQTFKGEAISADVYYDWNDTLSTRTFLSFGSNDPVFTRRILGQEVMIKPVKNLVLTAGFTDREYFGNVDATTYSGGPTWYFDGGFVKYTFTHYAIQDRENTHSHLATVRLNDGEGEGYTQAWLGGGTSVQEYEFVVPNTKGDVVGVAVRRVQPINSALALTLGADYQWFDTPILEYKRWGLTGGLQANF